MAVSDGVPPSLVSDFDLFHDERLKREDIRLAFADIALTSPPLFYAPRNGGHRGGAQRMRLFPSDRRAFPGVDLSGNHGCPAVRLKEFRVFVSEYFTDWSNPQKRDALREFAIGELNSYAEMRKAEPRDDCLAHLGAMTIRGGPVRHRKCALPHIFQTGSNAGGNGFDHARASGRRSRVVNGSRRDDGEMILKMLPEASMDESRVKCASLQKNGCGPFSISPANREAIRDRAWDLYWRLTIST